MPWGPAPEGSPPSSCRRRDCDFVVRHRYGARIPPLGVPDLVRKPVLPGADKPNKEHDIVRPGSRALARLRAPSRQMAEWKPTTSSSWFRARPATARLPEPTLPHSGRGQQPRSLQVSARMCLGAVAGRGALTSGQRQGRELPPRAVGRPNGLPELRAGTVPTGVAHRPAWARVQRRAAIVTSSASLISTTSQAAGSKSSALPKPSQSSMSWWSSWRGSARASFRSV